MTPVPVTLDGHHPHGDAAAGDRGLHGQPTSHVELQLVATTVAYATPQLGGSVTFSTVRVTLPVAATLTPKG